MSEKQEDFEWCMLWQYEGKPIEEVLRAGINHFFDKYGKKPKKIYVNDSTSIRNFEGIHLVHDKYMYAKGLIAMVI